MRTVAVIATALIVLGVSALMYLAPARIPQLALAVHRPPAASLRPTPPFAAPTPSFLEPIPADHPYCPLSSPPLEPGPDPATNARETAIAAIPRLYPYRNLAGWLVAGVHPAEPNDDGYGQIPYGMCGSLVGSRTWVVDLAFPAKTPSQSASQGTLFVARFAKGWEVWYQYH